MDYFAKITVLCSKRKCDGELNLTDHTLLFADLHFKI